MRTARVGAIKVRRPRSSIPAVAIRSRHLWLTRRRDLNRGLNIEKDVKLAKIKLEVGRTINILLILKLLL